MAFDLDYSLKRLAKETYDKWGIDYSNKEGAGAAGGIGFAFMAFLGGKIISGVDAVLDYSKIKDECLLLTDINNMSIDEIVQNGRKNYILNYCNVSSSYIQIKGCLEAKELDKLLEQLKNENFLAGLDKENLAKRLAYYLAELNVLHPFREGNGRTNREFIRQLALKNGYTLNLKKVPPQKILEASIESIVDTTKLEELFKTLLQS